MNWDHGGAVVAISTFSRGTAPLKASKALYRDFVKLVRFYEPAVCGILLLSAAKV